MTTRALRFALAIALILPATAAVAQREGYSYLSFAGSEVSLVSKAEDDSSARLNTPILAGDRMTTGASSRAEAILADGNVLRIDVQTSLRFDKLAKTYEAEDDRNAIYLEQGAISLEHRGSTGRDQATRIDTDDATVLFPDKGLARIETGRRGTEIYVTSGRAEVHARSGQATLRAGQYAFVTADEEPEVDALDEPRDRFTRFVEERRDLAAGDSGTRYVSSDYAYDYSVGEFDRYGSWISVNGSSAWRPSVGADWRPYVDGYWRWSPAGLTWVSYEPWGWLPYHYGSWLWDVGFGWYWTPGMRYSPAWVYWDYTPSWVGWCPIGYYGGYYGGYGGGFGGWGGGNGGYDRSHRYRRGAERWTHAYPHLRGRVDVTRIDPRGWSYASVGRIGSRFDARRDVLGHERVGFRPGDRGLIATTPLRIDRGRGGSATAAVQDAVRRVPQTLGASPRGGGGNDDITTVLRRDGSLGATTQEALRRSFVTPGQDPAYRPVPADQIAAPRRDAVTGPTVGVPSRGGERGLGDSSARSRNADSSAPSREPGSGTREAWRDAGVSTGARGTRSAETAPRRDAETPLGGGFGRDRNVRGDDGWRSPGRETRSGTTPPRTLDVPTRRSAPAPESSETPARTGRREAAPESESWRGAAEPPSRRDAPSSPESDSSSPGRREAPAGRGDEGWRGGDVPSRGSRPVEAPPSRSYSAPPRSYEAPSRSYSAPSRSYEAPSRSYSAPPRSYEAPSRSYSAPSRSAEPPSRSYSAPSRSHESSPSRSYSAPSSRSAAPPPSRSSDSPRRSASPRG
jgi:hypothetical protein